MTDTAALPTRRQRPRRKLEARLLIPVAIIVVVVLTAILGPMFLSYDPITTVVVDRLLPPGAQTSTGAVAVLGTDHLGRDLLAQIVYGARTSVIVGASTVLVAVIVGTLVGVVAGYWGGWLDVVVRRLVDITVALPSILLAILIAGVFAGSLLTIVVALAATAWVGIARVSRATTLSTVERPWVEAARMLRVPAPVLVIRHILPFVVAPVLALATVEFALAVIAEAGLSFLGIGLPSSTPSWGQTIANGRDYLTTAWWISAFSGAVLAIFVISVGLLGDYLNRHYGRRFLSA